MFGNSDHGSVYGGGVEDEEVVVRPLLPAAGVMVGVARTWHERESLVCRIQVALDCGLRSACCLPFSEYKASHSAQRDVALVHFW